MAELLCAFLYIQFFHQVTVPVQKAKVWRVSVHASVFSSRFHDKNDEVTSIDLSQVKLLELAAGAYRAIPVEASHALPIVLCWPRRRRVASLGRRLACGLLHFLDPSSRSTSCHTSRVIMSRQSTSVHHLGCSQCLYRLEHIVRLLRDRCKYAC